MTEVEHLAAFVTRVGDADLSALARQALKARVLDALGCAIGAFDGPPLGIIRSYVDAFGGRPLVTLMGGGKTSPDRATLYNGALVRYLDFNDSYLAKGETCHPSDNLAPILAASEYADRPGKDLLVSLAVAYQVQCRLSDVAPVRARGFDHTTQGAYAVAAGVSKALGLTAMQTAHAIAIGGVANNALRVTRTGPLSSWKGLAYPNTAANVVQTTFLAKDGITGPLEIFEGNKGFKHALAGPFTVDWERQDLEAVRQTIVKKYNAEIHAQSALEATLDLRRARHIEPAAIARIEIEIFDVAYHIIGGGEEGSKHEVRTKEQADHSLPYLVTVALLDGAVGPPQFAPDRILRDDVQRLLRKVVVRPDSAFSRRFPGELPVRVRVWLSDGQSIGRERSDYEGFSTRPMTWDRVVGKFHALASTRVEPDLRRAIVDAVADLEAIRVADLTALLGRIGSATTQDEAARPAERARSAGT